MAHKTMVNGTAYEIKGGRTLVDGTAYDIKRGKTLVDGTSYEIGFGKTQTVVISGDPSSWYSYATIEGSTYASASTYEFQTTGTLNISVYVSSVDSTVRNLCTVRLNDTTVKSGSGTYSFTTDADTIQIKFVKNIEIGKVYYWAVITTT